MIAALLAPFVLASCGGPDRLPTTWGFLHTAADRGSAGSPGSAAAHLSVPLRASPFRLCRTNLGSVGLQWLYLVRIVRRGKT